MTAVEAGMGRLSERFGPPPVGKIVTLLLTFIFLVVALPTLMVLSEDSLGDILPVAPFLLVVIWSGSRLSLATLKVWSRLPEIVFHLFCYIWLGLAPLLQVQTGVAPLPYSLNDADYFRAGVLVICGIIVFETVRAVVMRNRSSDRSLVVLTKRGNLIAASWFVVALAGIMVVLAGGPEVFLSSRQEFNVQIYGEGGDKASGAIFSSLLIVPPFVALAALLHRGPAGSSSFHYRTILIALVTVNVLINNPVVQGRFWFTTVWASLLVILAVRRGISLSALPAAFVLFTLFIFPNSDIFRYAGASIETYEFAGPVEQLTTKGDFDSIQQIALGLAFVDERGHTLGAQVLGTLFFFIPRSLWPDKPIDTGSVLANYVGFGNTNLSAPLWIEAFMDGGFVLLVVAFVILGIAVARMQSNTSPAFGAMIFAFYQLVLLRGSLLSSMATGATLLVVYLVFSRLGTVSAEADEVGSSRSMQV